ncbi:MAG: PspC domain-containing protein [Bacteroidetes bacterium]|nr:PspC domain-containing protein [Bacteroidota bacterium]
MNKTVNINIGGVVFHIEEDAYEKLSRYLENIKVHFRGSEGFEEIISDIEARIAEMFQAKLKTDKQVILMNDVEEIKEAMGMPEDFGGDIEEEQPRQDSSQSQRTRRKGRIFRNADERVFGGVCSGIGAYLDVDPIWIRLAFVLGFFFFGTGVLLYIILWIIIPPARSTAEKIEMKGEKVNVSSIEKTLKEEFDNLKQRFDDFTGSKAGTGRRERRSAAGAFVDRIVDLVISLIKIAFRVFGKLLGVILLVISVLGLIFLVGGMLGLFTADIFIFPMAPFLFGSSLHSVLAFIGALLLFGIPIIVFMYKGIQFLFKFKIKTPFIGIGALSLWILGWVLSGILVVHMVQDFSHRAQFSEHYEDFTLDADMLYLDILPDGVEDAGVIIRIENESIKTLDDHFAFSFVTMDIVKTDAEDFKLQIFKSARGHSGKDAYHRAKSIQYNIESQDSSINFSSYYSIDKEDLWRNQRVKVLLKVPVGKAIYMSHDMREIIYGIGNVTNTFDGDMVGHTWMMKEKGLTCLDCEDETIEAPEPSTEYEGKETRLYYLDKFISVQVAHNLKERLLEGEKYRILSKGRSDGDWESEWVWD